MTVSRLERSGKCEEAIALLKGANACDDPQWYYWLVVMNLDCQAKTRRREFGTEALRLVDEGIGRFPQSARLVLLKGFVWGRQGELALLLKYNRAALDLARANIAADQFGGTREDHEVVSTAGRNLAGTAWQAP